LNDALLDAIRKLHWVTEQKDWSVSISPEEARAILSYIDGLTYSDPEE
jgi:hypothetical protein